MTQYVIFNSVFLCAREELWKLVVTVESWMVLSCRAVSNIGFITVYGLNEGHIAPYTDIEFQLAKHPPNIHHNEIPRQIVTTDIWINYYAIDKR